MSNRMKYRPSELMAQLIDHEGIRYKPYVDTTGHWTVGIGHKLSPSESKSSVRTPEQVVNLYAKDIKRFEDWLFDPYFQHKDAVSRLNGTRQRILVDMAYNLGQWGLLKFRKMWAALAEGDFDKAADEMMDSRWAVQTKRRAVRLSDAMRKGKFEPEFGFSRYNALVQQVNRDETHRRTA